MAKVAILNSKGEKIKDLKLNDEISDFMSSIKNNSVFNESFYATFSNALSRIKLVHKHPL